MPCVRQPLLCHPPGSVTSHIDAVLQESLDHLGRNLGVRVDTSRRREHVHTALSRELPNVLHGNEALPRAVQAYEDHCISRCQAHLPLI
jgi:hypothetical protein